MWKWNWTSLLCICVISVLEALGQSGDGTQRFYLEIQELADNFTSVEECTSANVCLRDPQSDLKCMCGARYEEAEEVKKECVTNRTRLSVEETDMPSVLEFCSDAFLKLGYSVSVVNISNSSNGAVESYTNAILSEKIAELKSYSDEFSRLLSYTIVGVYLRDELQRETCKDAYNEWLCTTFLSLYSSLNDTCHTNCKEETVGVVLANGTTVKVARAKPCLGVCTRVVQQCPYYLPSTFQDQNDSRFEETIYGGYPVFDCPERSILKHFKDSCKDCYHPYSLCDDCCIGRGAAANWNSAWTHMIVISFFLCMLFSS